MKKIISISSLVLSLVIFFGVYDYVKLSFSYQVAQDVGYVFYWSVVLFLLSLLAGFLEEKKYKKWILVSGVYIILALFSAYAAGDGHGTIVDFDGQLVTFVFTGLYLLVSLVYFVVQFVKNRR